MIAAWGMWHTKDFYVSLLGAGGMLNINGIDRVIHLGSATRTETGSTGGSHLGFELAAGYWFNWEELKSGPFASLSRERVRVGSYSENGDDSTAMTFGRQNRDSQIYKIGWEIAGDSRLFGDTWHPYARVAYEHEGDGRTRYVTAGLATLNGTFSMQGFQPDSSYYSGELGISADLRKNMTAFAAYDGHFGDSNQRIDSYNIGFKWAW
jgi:outer membrane lipase/esterase